MQLRVQENQMNQEKRYNRSAVDKARRLRNKITTHTCVVCARSFTANHKRKYCSIECNPHIRKWDKSPRECLSCNSKYTPIRSDQKYCNRNCNPYNKRYIDPFYQTKEWKQIRASFLELSTVVDGISITNKYCIECYRRNGTLTPTHAVDHIIRRRDGGSDEYNNLQSLCLKHHQSKSAIERNTFHLSQFDTRRGVFPTLDRTTRNRGPEKFVLAISNN